jgi:hypothetical protein
MINMKALPPSRAALLSRVKIRLDCPAVIAGGAIRDLLLAEANPYDLRGFEAHRRPRKSARHAP